MNDELLKRFGEEVIYSVMTNLKINRDEAERFVEMPLCEQRSYVENKTGRPYEFREGLPLTSRTH